MKSILLLLTMTFAMQAMAIQSPFKPGDEKLLSSGVVNLQAHATIVGSSPAGKAIVEPVGSDGQMARRHFRATFDTQVDGTAVGAYPLGISLPANSIITEGYLYTVTQFVDSGSGTVAFSCEDANNIYTASDLTGLASGTLTSTIDSASLVGNAVQNIASACEITATIGTVSQSAGKVILFGSYITVE